MLSAIRPLVVNGRHVAIWRYIRNDSPHAFVLSLAEFVDVGDWGLFPIKICLRVGQEPFGKSYLPLIAGKCLLRVAERVVQVVTAVGR